MCGIAGYWGGRNLPEIGERMALQIRHRGPDDAGVWAGGPTTPTLAHRRLAVIDLSPAGHQPMVSPCGRLVLVYNGEIYNHNDLRQQLERERGHFNWRGHSDTETLLAALRHWGISGALRRVNGMFAFAVWDQEKRFLYLARDRMGEKPLYYGHSGTILLFGSELKALTAHPGWQAVVNRDALTLYLRHSYVPTPWSIYGGISKLPPAHFVVVGDGGRTVSQPISYWDLGAIAAEGVNQASDEIETLTDELDVLLRDAVGRRLAADVPLGAFLSGGYDSTMVTALMQRQTDRPVKTFSIGFDEDAYNEAHHAKAVAEHLGTDHTELYVTSEETMAVIPKLPLIWDEPFSDDSQIPTYLISQLARQHVTVSLSGDGGDELFCGYNRYALGYQVWSKLRLLPSSMRRPLAVLLARAPGRLVDNVVGLLPPKLRVLRLSDQLPKLAAALQYTDGERFYRQLVSHWKEPEQVVIGGHEPMTLLGQPERLPLLSDLRDRMMYLDAMTYLPDDILTKVDRASMAVSLEARVPLLDHKLVEFAWRVPTALKYRDGQGKWLLRQVLYRYVPRNLTDRPKQGFGVPIGHWLCGPLRDWAEALIAEPRLRNEGFFNPAPIRTMWREHLSGQRHSPHDLWNVLMFQAWLEARC